MIYTYKPSGICAKEIEIEVVDGKVQDVRINGGCDGNHKGIISLVKGMPVDEVISRLEGITCGPRSSSCPDQLAQALKASKQA